MGLNRPLWEIKEVKLRQKTPNELEPLPLYIETGFINAKGEVKHCRWWFPHTTGIGMNDLVRAFASCEEMYHIDLPVRDDKLADLINEYHEKRL
jgi:hypothetical protein